MNTRSPVLSVSTLTFSCALALLVGACDPREASEPDASLAEPSDERVEIDDVAEASQPEPSFRLALEGGASLSFFVDDDGSVAMLEEVPLDGKVASVLDDPRLADASPAVVYHALTDDGVAVPEPLRAHHEGLAADGVLPPLAEALAEQPRNITAAPLADESSPCLNATFDTNHCDHPEYDEAQCWFNAQSGLAWNVPGADRYKAGFCLQSGQARSWLYYSRQAGDCSYFNEAVFAWGMDSNLFGTRYSATTYRVYTWWRSSGGLRRSFHHAAIPDAGAVYDFGNRYSWGYGCP